MKISELCERSGVPLPTVKFYIREGLLPAGQRTAKNQADYTDAHLSRLALIRALKDDAGLPIGTIADALRTSDAVRARGRGGDFVIAAIDGLQRPSGAAVDERSAEFARAYDDIRNISKEFGWPMEKVEMAHREAARALAIVRRSYDSTDARPYAEVARTLAMSEVPDTWRPESEPEVSLHYAVLGTVLAEPLLLALRRIAHVARALEVEKRGAREQKEEKAQKEAARAKKPAARARHARTRK